PGLVATVTDGRHHPAPVLDPGLHRGGLLRGEEVVGGRRPVVAGDVLVPNVEHHDDLVRLQELRRQDLAVERHGSLRAALVEPGGEDVAAVAPGADLPDGRDVQAIADAVTADVEVVDDAVFVVVDAVAQLRGAVAGRAAAAAAARVRVEPGPKAARGDPAPQARARPGPPRAAAAARRAPVTARGAGAGRAAAGPAAVPLRVGRAAEEHGQAETSDQRHITRHLTTFWVDELRGQQQQVWNVQALPKLAGLFVLSGRNAPDRVDGVAFDERRGQRSVERSPRHAGPEI